MRDTQESNIYNEKNQIANPMPRFKEGDVVLAPYNGKIVKQTVKSVFWDKAFGGWLCCCHLIYIHEQNYILEAEQRQWKPHENGLQSWWTKRWFAIKRNRKRR